MKNFIMCAMILVAVLLLGCGEAQEITLYLQDLAVNGPVTQPPIYITKESEPGKIHIIPRISFPMQKTLEGRVEGHTMVNADGIFHVDTVRQGYGVYFRDPGNVNTSSFRGKNLQWKIPSSSVGLDIDYGASRSTSLALGATYSSTKGSGVWAYRVGLGLHGRDNRGTAGYRLDMGWMWQEHIYEVTTVVTERPLSSSASTVTFYQDREKQTRGSFYAALTFNSIQQEWPLNVFFQAGITKQSVTDIKPTAPQSEPWIIFPFFLQIPNRDIVIDRRGEFSPTLVHLTPGVYFNLSESACLVFGLRFSFETALDDLAPSTIISPVVQLDWEL